MMLRSAIHVTAFWLAVAAAVGAQEVPVDAHLQGFEPLGEYRLVVAGKADPAAAMYRSQRGGSAMLVEAPSLPGPVLLSPRARSVERVPAEKIVRNQDGSLDLLADAELAAAGSFEIDDGTVSFALDGREVRLEEKPYLLGLHGTEAMLERDPGYAFHAAKYSASPPILRGLKSVAEPVRVRVFFGSWCPSCKQMLPRILRVAEELAGTPIRFEFYGLPTPFVGEPEATRAGVSGVPTAVVYRGGQEIGRISGTQWKIPELALKRVLDGKAS